MDNFSFHSEQNNDGFMIPDLKTLSQLPGADPVLKNIVKKKDELKKKVKGLYPAAEYEELLMGGYDISKDLVGAVYSPEIFNNVEKLINACLTNECFYEEVLYARIGSQFYKSHYPKDQGHFLEITRLCEKYNYDPREPLQFIRSQTILKKWQKFRKAYEFDPELTKALFAMRDEVDVPISLSDHLPFGTVYLDLPKTSGHEYYSGVYISVNRFGNSEYIFKQNDLMCRIIKEALNMTGLSLIKDSERENKLKFIERQIVNNGRDMEMITGNDYLSFHMFFIGKDSDITEKGFFGDIRDTVKNTYTYLLPIFSDDNGICHVRKEDIYERATRSDFDDIDYLTELIMYILNTLMYLGANNADITNKKVKGVLKLKPIQKNKKRKLEFENTEIEVNKCGFVYGATVRAYKEQEDKEDKEYEERTGKKRPVRPHPVRGHYERYHVGKGRQEIMWKLKLPYVNRGSISGAEMPVNVSKVVKE